MPPLSVPVSVPDAEVLGKPVADAVHRVTTPRRWGMDVAADVGADAGGDVSGLLAVADALARDAAAAEAAAPPPPAAPAPLPPLPDALYDLAVTARAFLADLPTASTRTKAGVTAAVAVASYAIGRTDPLVALAAYAFAHRL